MNIYFVGAISQLEALGDTYKKIVEILERGGHTVQANHVLNQKIEQIFSESSEEKVRYYKQFLRWLSMADIVVVEATFPSTVHIGFEISVALERGKPVIVLYKKGKQPVFLQGVKSDRLTLVEYVDDDLKLRLLEAVGYSSEQMDTRFNFFLSRKLSAYLDWIAKDRRIPRAVYLRQLIRETMKNTKGYTQ